MLNLWISYEINPYSIRDLDFDKIDFFSYLLKYDPYIFAFSKLAANWVTKLSTPTKEGKIDLVVVEPYPSEEQKKLAGKPSESGLFQRLLKDEIRRIRVIMEDVNGLRDVTSEYSVSPFARLMIQDFMDPIELYAAK